MNIAPNGFVAIPQTGTGPQGPTGIVSNANTAAFQLVPGTPSTSARFIFANLNGTIFPAGQWRQRHYPSDDPRRCVHRTGHQFCWDPLYAANGTGGINVFDSSFAPASLPGAFTDPNLPAGFVPFNVSYKAKSM